MQAVTHGIWLVAASRGDGHYRSACPTRWTENESVARHRKPEPVDGEFRLLFVCTGNICRSPFAEILTRHLLVGRLGGRVAGRFEISSAGVQAVVGSPMHPDS